MSTNQLLPKHSSRQSVDVSYEGRGSDIFFSPEANDAIKVYFSVDQVGRCAYLLFVDGNTRDLEYVLCKFICDSIGKTGET
jgi:hypothetical protein